MDAEISDGLTLPENGHSPGFASPKRHGRFRLMAEVAEYLLSNDEPERLVLGLFERVSQSLGLATYFNFMVDESGEALRLDSCAGVPDEVLGTIGRLEFGQSVCGTVAAERRPIVATDIQASDDPKVQLIKSLGIRSYACNPLMVGDRLLGTLSFGLRDRDRLDDDELEFLETVSHYVALAKERIRLLAEAKERVERLAASEAALRESNRRKDEFLAALSHELRTPLTPVLMTVAALETDPRIPEDVRLELKMVHRNVELEVRLIDDLLDSARITQGKLPLDLRMQDAHARISDVVRICRDEIAEKRLNLVLEMRAERHCVPSDGDRLQQVLWNLVKNAVKFTPEGGTVRVRTEDAAGNRLAIRVIDSGIGIESQLLPHVFNVFEQGGGETTKRFGGLGLGLAISKAVVEAHGGTLTAFSEGRDRGATFTVELAGADFPAEATGETPGTAGCGQRALRILLVEDHKDTSRIMARMLTGIGHTVTTAETVAEALATAGSSEFDLVISDLGLPDGSGLDLMRQLRPLPGIALTGYGMDEDVTKTREVGFIAHLTKPVDMRQLEAAIEGIDLDI